MIVIFLFILGAGVETRALHVLDKHSAIKPLSHKLGPKPSFRFISMMVFCDFQVGNYIKYHLKKLKDEWKYIFLMFNFILLKKPSK